MEIYVETIGICRPLSPYPQPRKIAQHGTFVERWNITSPKLNPSTLIWDLGPLDLGFEDVWRLTYEPPVSHTF